MGAVTSKLARERGGAASFMPPRMPCPMPVQSLRHKPDANGAPEWSAAITARRLLVVGGTAAMTSVAAYEMYAVLEVGGITVLEGLVLALFVALFAWVAFSSLSCVIGFGVLLTGARAGISLLPPPAKLSARTALLFPVYNEDPAPVLRRIRAMQRSIAEIGHGESFDVYILSDTTDPDVWIAEEKLVLALQQHGSAERIFYRHRNRNVARKSGNIQDWVSSFGGGYAHMIILDADSLMSGDTVVRLAATMEGRPKAGLIQTLPMIVNADTLFARLQQFAGRLYGPLIAAGVAWWHGSEGNYWGHNAIIRVSAFAAHAGLPELRGRKPFGGHVLSHDFVEAALMRRAGWGVYMAHDAGGSFEECPPSPIDYAARDRRWCQGNLQHIAVLGTRGLHWVSRLHLLTGIGSYLTSPMLLAFLTAGIAITLQVQFVRPEYFPAGISLFPTWPAQDPVRAMWVFVGTMGLLLLPKLLALLLVLGDRMRRRAYGGALRLSTGVLIETLLSALLAPTMMVFQSMAVADIMIGRDSGWQAQSRVGGKVPLRVLTRSYAVPTALGVTMAVSAVLVSLPLLLWMSPVIVGLLLSIPLAALLSSRNAGQVLKRLGLLSTPEELSPPPLLAAARVREAEPAVPPAGALTILRDGRALREAHLTDLAGIEPRQRGQVDQRLATAMAKVEDADSFDEAVAFLDRGETFAVLASSTGLARLFARFGSSSAPL